MNGLLIGALLLAQTVAVPIPPPPQQVYILDHPIDPNLLLAVTPDGRFPFAPLQGSDCSWLHSDMNVTLSGQQDKLWLVTDDAGDACFLAVQDRVDTTPCLTNDDNECDIAEEHNFG